MSEDKKRIGFQVHNILGLPGNKYEVALGKAHFLNPLDLKSDGRKGLMASAYAPVKVDGINRNLLFDKDGFLDMKSPAIAALSGSQTVVESKQSTLEWKKNLKNRKK